MVDMQRTFLGHHFTMFFYKTSPILVIPFAVFLHRSLNNQQRKRNLFISFLLGVALILSGTRANMFSVILIVIFLVIHQMYKSRFWRPLSFCLLFLLFLLVPFVVAHLFQDVTESNIIKSNHVNSIVSLFREHPLVLLVGQGPGSIYYTTGVGEYTAQSEVSYLEIIRMFGLVMGSIIIFCFFLPLIIAYKRKNKIPEFFPLFISYLAYLCIGATNPLLFSSTGILALASAYSFALKEKKDENY
jgi:hypothetical protein